MDTSKRHPARTGLAALAALTLAATPLPVQAQPQDVRLACAQDGFIFARRDRCPPPNPAPRASLNASHTAKG